MNIQKTIVLAILIGGTMVACAEKNKKGNQETIKNDVDQVVSKVKETVSEEEKRKADSILRIEDSLRQVKEHGHVH